MVSHFQSLAKSCGEASLRVQPTEFSSSKPLPYNTKMQSTNSASAASSASTQPPPSSKLQPPTLVPTLPLSSSQTAANRSLNRSIDETAVKPAPSGDTMSSASTVPPLTLVPFEGSIDTPVALQPPEIQPQPGDVSQPSSPLKTPTQVPPHNTTSLGRKANDERIGEPSAVKGPEKLQGEMNRFSQEECGVQGSTATKELGNAYVDASSMPVLQKELVTTEETIIRIPGADAKPVKVVSEPQAISPLPNAHCLGPPASETHSVRVEEVREASYLASSDEQPGKEPTGASNMLSDKRADELGNAMGNGRKSTENTDPELPSLDLPLTEWPTKKSTREGKRPRENAQNGYPLKKKPIANEAEKRRNLAEKLGKRKRNSAPQGENGKETGVAGSRNPEANTPEEFRGQQGVVENPGPVLLEVQTEFENDIVGTARVQERPTGYSLLEESKYRQSLLPELPEGPRIRRNAQWTREEDITVARLHREIGNDWEKISRILGTRSVRALRNRWSTKNQTAKNSAAQDAQKFVENDSTKNNAAQDAQEFVENDSTANSAVLSARRENIALRWALVRASSRLGNSEEMDNSLTKSGTDLVSSIPLGRSQEVAGNGVGNCENPTPRQVQNVVVESILTVRMASAWASSGAKKLPNNIRTPISESQLPESEELSRPIALLVEFLSETIAFGFPMGFEDARLSVAVLVQSGLLPILHAMADNGSFLEKCNNLVTRIQAILLDILNREGDIRWVSILAEELLSPVFYWTTEKCPSAVAKTFRTSLTTALALVMERCGHLLAEANPNRFSIAHEVCMALVDVDSAIIRAIKPEVREILSSVSSLFRLVSAMEIEAGDDVRQLISAAGHDVQKESFLLLQQKLVLPEKRLISDSSLDHQPGVGQLPTPTATEPTNRRAPKRRRTPGSIQTNAPEKRHSAVPPHPAASQNIPANICRAITNIGSFT